MSNKDIIEVPTPGPRDPGPQAIIDARTAFLGVMPILAPQVPPDRAAQIFDSIVALATEQGAPLHERCYAIALFQALTDSMLAAVCTVPPGVVVAH